MTSPTPEALEAAVAEIEHALETAGPYAKIAAITTDAIRAVLTALSPLRPVSGGTIEAIVADEVRRHFYKADHGQIATVAARSASRILAILPHPEGRWRLVPAESTREMRIAYFDSIDKHMKRVETDPTFGRFRNHEIAYRAMLAAAPIASQDGGAG